MTRSTLKGLALYTFAAVTGFLLVRAGRPAKEAEPPKSAASAVAPAGPVDLSLLNLPELKLPTARTVPDLVTELESEEMLKLTSWQLGYPKTMRLMEAMLAEKRNRNGNDAAAAIGWLAGKLMSGQDSASLAALAGEPADLTEAARVLDLLGGPGQAMAFAEAVLSQQCALGAPQAAAWLAEMKKRRLGTTEPYEARDFLPAEDAYDNLLERWRDEGARDVLTRIGKLELPEEDRLVFARQWLYGPAGRDAAELAANVRQPGLTPAVVDEVMQMLMSGNPALAAQTLVELDLPRDQQAGLENRILSAWVEKDPLAALPWFYEHRSKLKEEDALQNLVGLWVSRSPWSLQTYVDKAPQGKDTDELILAVVARLRQQGEAGEFENRHNLISLKRGAVEAMSGRLSEPGLRERAMRDLPANLPK